MRGRRVGDIVALGQDRQKWVHSEVTGDKNQAGTLIKNVRDDMFRNKT